VGYERDGGTRAYPVFFGLNLYFKKRGRNQEGSAPHEETLLESLSIHDVQELAPGGLCWICSAQTWIFPNRLGRFGECRRRGLEGQPCPGMIQEVFFDAVLIFEHVV
jgi:hypothetical protein